MKNDPFKIMRDKIIKRENRLKSIRGSNPKPPRRQVIKITGKAITRDRRFFEHEAISAQDLKTRYRFNTNLKDLNIRSK